MSDLTEALRSAIVNLNLSAVHVGEDIPQFTGQPYIWFMRSGELTDDSLNCDDPTGVFIDVEVVSVNINECRLLTEQLKYGLRGIAPFSIQFTENNATRRIAAFDIENHDDTYLQHNADMDKRIHVGSFLLTAYYD